MEIQVFNYHDPIEFLNDTYQSLRLRNSSFSMRSWAKQLGLNHVAILSMVLGRKRRLLPNLSSKISQSFRKSGKFSENEARYFDILVLFNNSHSLEEKEFYRGILSSLKPGDQTFSTIELDQLKVISDWYHLAILELTELKNFKSDSRWISLQLGNSVNKRQVEEAIERLLRLGLLKKMKKGDLKKSERRFSTSTDITNLALQRLHTQLIEKALHSLQKDPVSKRDVTGHMIATSSHKLIEAKKRIQQFRKDLAKFLEDSAERDTVFQLNVQLFDVLGDQKNV